MHYFNKCWAVQKEASFLFVFRSLFGATLRLLSHCFLTLCSLASVTAPTYVCCLQYLSLQCTYVHFLDVSRTKDNIHFCKAYCHLSTVSLSAKECPLYLSHADTWSRLASRKCCVFTLESEKTYSFRCVFSFSVSSTMTSLLGTFWDLMSCKTKQRLSVMSYNHQN